MSNTDDFRRFAVDARAAAGKLRTRTSQVVRATAARVQRDARILAPVRTGFLRNSIGVDTREGDNAVSAEVGPAAYYGVFVELGTSRMAPRPYLFPAADRHTSNFYAAMEQLADMDD